jgi:hypothetical protein
VRNDHPGDAALVAGAHLGFRSKHKEIFEEMKELMTMDLAMIKQTGKEVKAIGYEVKPVLTKEQLEGQILDAFLRETISLKEFEKVDLGNDEVVYTALEHKDGEGKRFFARLISRPPPCDLCHDIHFLYVFEETGKILQFIPILLTKWGNEDWDEKDVEKMRGRVLGRSMKDAFDFDPAVDAVTSATITSAVVFKSLSEGRALYEALKAKGFM